MKIKQVPGAGRQKLEILLKELKNAEVRVGWFDTAEYPDGTKVAQVAVVQEYGDPEHKIPPRPFMRPTIRTKQSEWKAAFDILAQKIAKNEITMAQALEQMGGKAAGDVRKKISTIWSPPLADSTIEARKRQRANKTKVGNLNKPLVDQKYLINTLTHVVVAE